MKTTPPRWRELDREAALNYDPDLVLCGRRAARRAEEHQAVMEDDFANNPDYWNSIPAIADGDVLYLPAQLHRQQRASPWWTTSTALVDIVLRPTLRSEAVHEQDVANSAASTPCGWGRRCWLLLHPAWPPPVLGARWRSAAPGYSVPEILRAAASARRSHAIKVDRLSTCACRVSCWPCLIGASLVGGGRPAAVGDAQPPGRPRHHRRIRRRGHGGDHHPPPLPEPHLRRCHMFAFGGAALACVLIYMLAWKEAASTPRGSSSRAWRSTRCWGRTTRCLQLLNSDSLEGVLAFMNGSLSGR